LGLLRNIDKLRLEAEKGHPVKQEKTGGKGEKAPEPAAIPLPAPQLPPAPPSGKLPTAEPLPEEGANP
jgi:hypothetical protein